MNHFILRFAIPCVLLLLVGCGLVTVPVYNLSERQVIAPKAVSLDEVQKAIIRAGASLGWQIVPRGTGYLEGITTWNVHRAHVDIKFDTKTYSIMYKDSDNLKYDGTNIHRVYNAKVQDLDKSIRAQLNLIGI
jgi:hypothetical protein